MSAALLANIATLGWYRRHAERVQVKRWKAAWRAAQGRPPIVMASTDFQAWFFANSRPDDTCRHRNAAAVETLDGETVAALCPDCGEQLEPEALCTPAQSPTLPPFTPDPRLTRKSWM